MGERLREGGRVSEWEPTVLFLLQVPKQTSTFFCYLPPWKISLMFESTLKTFTSEIHPGATLSWKFDSKSESVSPKNIKEWVKSLPWLIRGCTAEWSSLNFPQRLVCTVQTGLRMDSASRISLNFHFVSQRRALLWACAKKQFNKCANMYHPSCGIIYCQAVNQGEACS